MKFILIQNIVISIYRADINEFPADSFLGFCPSYAFGLCRFFKVVRHDLNRQIISGNVGLFIRFIIGHFLFRERLAAIPFRLPEEHNRIKCLCFIIQGIHFKMEGRLCHVLKQPHFLRWVQPHTPEPVDPINLLHPGRLEFLQFSPACPCHLFYRVQGFVLIRPKRLVSVLNLSAHGTREVVGNKIPHPA